MKRKLFITALTVLLSLFICATALAAGRVGLTDYFSSLVGVIIPEDMNDFIQTDVMFFENENFIVSVRELLYDGQTAYAAVDVTPKADKTLLLGLDTSMSYSWYELIDLRSDADPDDERTIWQVFEAEGYESAYNAEIRLFDSNMDTQYGSDEYCLNEDGTLTYFPTIQFADYQPKREITLRLICSGVRTGKDKTQSKTVPTFEEMPLKLTANTQEEIFVSAEPVRMEDAGVTIDQLQIRATSIGLYSALYYTIDGELPAGVSGSDLELMLVDPAIESNSPYDALLQSGLVSGSAIASQRLSAEGETPERYVTHLAFDLSELRDSYTVRGVNPASYPVTYYEPVTLTMKPETADDTLITAD